MLLRLDCKLPRPHLAPSRSSGKPLGGKQDGWRHVAPATAAAVLRPAPWLALMPDPQDTLTHDTQVRAHPPAPAMPVSMLRHLFPSRLPPHPRASAPAVASWNSAITHVPDSRICHFLCRASSLTQRGHACPKRRHRLPSPSQLCLSPHGGQALS